MSKGDTMISLLLAISLGCGSDSATGDALSLGADTAEGRSDAPRYVPDAEDGLSVVSVDPARYLGLWYEIATSPSQQQTACAGTTAEYTLIDEATIGVTNRCYLGSLDGRLNSIEGTARPIDDTYARLLVDLGFGFEAPYTVIDLVETADDEPYSYATVSAAGFQYWILSRTPQIPDAVYTELMDRLEARGADSGRLVRTEQPLD